jgi:cytochrome c556
MRLFPLATQIRDWAEKMPAYFPAEALANHPKHHRKSGWIFSGFERAANANYQAANQLVIAAKAGWIPRPRSTAFKATAATCKSCHKSYKLD